MLTDSELAQSVDGFYNLHATPHFILLSRRCCRVKVAGPHHVLSSRAGYSPRGNIAVRQSEFRCCIWVAWEVERLGSSSCCGLSFAAVTLSM